MPPVPVHVRRQRLLTFSALVTAVIAAALLVSVLAGLWP